MTPFRPAVVGQDYSARRLVAEQVPVLTHNAEGKVLLSVGTTLTQQSEKDPVLAMAHFCSARFQLVQLLKSGDGIPVRQDDQYAVIVPKMWVPPEPGFLLMEAFVRPNGCLKIDVDPTVAPLFLAIPRKLMNDDPWAHPSGRFKVAKEYGYKYLDDALSAKGHKLALV